MNPAATTDAPEDLPRWRLDDLYAGPDAPEFAADLAEAQVAAQAFRTAHEGAVRDLSGAELGRAVTAYARIRDLAQRLPSFAYLRYAGDTLDPEIQRFYQDTAERITAVERELLFFTLELVRLDDAVLADPALAGCRPWLAQLRRFRPHRLSDEVEAMFMEKSVGDRLAWSRLYEETRAAWRLPIGGRECTNVEVLALLSHADGAIRRQAATALDTVLEHSDRTQSLILNALARDKSIEDRWRGYSRPIARRNLENAVEDSTVDALFAAVKAAYPRISHRYYRLKARWLGQDRLDHWDRLAPLPGDSGRLYGWDQARAIVLGAYAELSPGMAELGQRFFDRCWIDAAPRRGKAASGFCRSVPGIHPYLAINYLGRAENVLVLAHELGHGLHGVLSARTGPQPDLPLTLAETASVFGELLTFRRLLAAETDRVRRRALLARKVETMLHTAFRQIAYAEFERRFHDERGRGEVEPARLGKIFLETQAEYLGEAVSLTPDYARWWGNVGHYVHEPFYLYAYAFGECLATSLFAVYQAAPAGFAERYGTLLAAGGTEPHTALLAPFGLDPAAPGFWDKGLSVLEGFIDELEAE
jgi:oligoendopeptidase F